MMESMLLLLLALGGGGTPAASPSLAAGGPVPVTGVWRGTWYPAAGQEPRPVEAVLAPGNDAGTLRGLIVSGAGRDRRISRLSGRYERDGARLELLSGGAVRLSADGVGRLIGEVTIGEVKGGPAASFLPGDGALELTRVHR